MTKNAVSEDIMKLLHDNGYGVQGTDLFAMQWGSDSQDEQILVMDNGGLDPPLKDMYEQPVFQILVRGKKNGSAKVVHDRIRAIHEFLIVQDADTTINSTNYLEFEPLSSLSPVGKDENDRMVWSSNYYTYRNSID